jgi:hypothetical protein
MSCGPLSSIQKGTDNGGGKKINNKTQEQILKFLVLCG